MWIAKRQLPSTLIANKEPSAMSKDIYRYYVYAYLRPDGTPYYIGKGCDHRVYEKHRISVPKDKSRIVFLETNLSNVGACSLERRYIQWYGRKDIGTGILRNMTDGGDGGAGHVPSEETRAKLSAANKGKNNPMYGKLSPNKGKTLSPEHRAKLSAANKGKPKSLEHRTKISAANKDRWQKSPFCF